MRVDEGETVNFVGLLGGAAALLAEIDQALFV